MTGLAMFLQDRRDILGKCRRRVTRLLGTRLIRNTKYCDQENCEPSGRAPDYFHFCSPSTMVMYRSRGRSVTS
jgi:hypothetical protein